MTESTDFTIVALNEVERLREILRRWGRVLVAEGRITINDYRGAIFGMDDGIAVGDIRPDPLAEELARLHERMPERV